MTALVVPCLLLACIEVGDFGEYWDKGFVDPCANAVMKKNMMEDSDEDETSDIRNMRFHSLKVGKHLFMMIRNHPENPGGSIIRYVINNGDFVTYRLNDKKRDEFLATYPDAPVVLNDETATIPRLDGQSVQFLEKIADDSSYWLENTREPYNPSKRTDCKASN